ncbi:hypothetical protein J4466_04465 [Candidatus Pacearchaeota archaeon]|nr:hypothetical protein [Candidatus Pacearchaeota archaeon]
MRTTRREFLKTAAKITGVTSLFVSLESCVTDSRKDNYAELKYALRGRWKNISYENKRKTIEFWDKELDEEERKKFREIYKNPEEEYTKLDSKKKEIISDFFKNLDNTSFKETEEYKNSIDLIKYFPWITDINDIRRSDLVLLDYILSRINWH